MPSKGWIRSQQPARPRRRPHTPTPPELLVCDPAVGTGVLTDGGGPVPRGVSAPSRRCSGGGRGEGCSAFGLLLARPRPLGRASRGVVWLRSGASPPSAVAGCHAAPAGWPGCTERDSCGGTASPRAPLLEGCGFGGCSGGGWFAMGVGLGPHGTGREAVCPLGAVGAGARAPGAPGKTGIPFSGGLRPPGPPCGRRSGHPCQVSGEGLSGDPGHTGGRPRKAVHHSRGLGGTQSPLPVGACR